MTVSEAKLLRMVYVFPTSEFHAMHVYCMTLYCWNAEDREDAGRVDDGCDTDAAQNCGERHYCIGWHCEVADDDKNEFEIGTEEWPYSLRQFLRLRALPAMVKRPCSM